MYSQRASALEGVLGLADGHPRVLYGNTAVAALLSSRRVPASQTDES